MYQQIHYILTIEDNINIKSFWKYIQSSRKNKSYTLIIIKFCVH